MPAFLLEVRCLINPSGRKPPTINAQQAAADCINLALKKSDIVKICHSIGAATRLYNISDLAKKSGVARPSIHRAFAGLSGKTRRTE